jgi:hypothetical protein
LNPAKGVRFFLPKSAVPDCLTGEGNILPMHQRLIAILAVVFLAFGGGGCASSSDRNYEEVLMPLQTGSVLHRRTLVRTEREKTKKKKDEKKNDAKKKSVKPDAEPDATPAPDEETTPAPADRFR